MKNLLLFTSLFALIGCQESDRYILFGAYLSPRFKVGECFENLPTRKFEKWEKDSAFVNKVLEIGDYSYRLRVTKRTGDVFETLSFEESFTFSGQDPWSKKVDCPQILKDSK